MAFAPLHGVKVADFSRVLAGPFAAQSLADLGADVIKIENPVIGDDTRGWGFKIGTGTDSTYYQAVNRSKRGVALDLRTPEGQKIAADLAAECDILVENFKPGGMERFGLGYEALKERNPRLIYCAVSGYGRTGPYRHRLGYDIVVQGEAGLMNTNGNQDQDPLKIGLAVVDLFTGLYLTQAAMAALIARERTGEGQYVDISLYDCGLSMLNYMGNSTMFSGKDPYRFGNDHPYVLPYGLFEAKDGPLIIAVGNDSQFNRLCKNVLQRDDIADDPRFLRNQGRMEHREALMLLLRPAIATKTRAELHAGMEEYGIPGGAVRGVSEALESPETRDRGMTIRVPHPEVGEVGLFRSPMRLSETPAREPARPPLLGEHTDEVLREHLHLNDAQLADLRVAKIIE